MNDSLDGANKGNVDREEVGLYPDEEEEEEADEEEEEEVEVEEEEELVRLASVSFTLPNPVSTHSPPTKD